MKGTMERLAYVHGLSCIGARWQSPFDLFEHLPNLEHRCADWELRLEVRARNMLLASRASKPPVPAPVELRIFLGLRERARKQPFPAA